MTDNRPYLIVGSITKDKIGANRYTIGGTVSFAAAIARQLGITPHIVTAAGADLVLSALLENSAQWHILPSPQSNTFENIYTPTGRRQIISGVAQTLTAADIPAAWQSPGLIHIAPLTQDVDPSIIEHFPNAIKAVTPQGWLRHWNTEGEVTNGHWEDLPANIGDYDVVVISIEDANDDWGMVAQLAARIPLLVVTTDYQGCVVFQGNRDGIAIPTRRVDVVDATGAGDAFATAFFIRYLETGDSLHAAHFANVTASMFLETVGYQSTPDRAAVEAAIRSQSQ